APRGARSRYGRAVARAPTAWSPARWSATAAPSRAGLTALRTVHSGRRPRRRSRWLCASATLALALAGCHAAPPDGPSPAPPAPVPSPPPATTADPGGPRSTEAGPPAAAPAADLPVIDYWPSPTGF